MSRKIIASLTIIPALIAVIAFSDSAQASGVNGNPWNYSFDATGGTVITAPNPAFCNYFHCIPSFWNKTKGQGHVIECHDQMFSRSGGLRGSCSKHGGDWRILYAHSVTHRNPSQPGSSNPVSSGSTTTSPELPLTGSDPYAHKRP